MAFSEDNQRWILDRIEEAVNPNGWTKVALWLRFWSLPGTAITVSIALIAMIITLSVSTFNRIEANATFRQHTEDRLSGIEIQLVSLRALVAASNPTRKQNQDAAKELIAEAKVKGGASIPASTVEQAGRSFLDASATDPQAWLVALDFVNYRSVLNESAARLIQQTARWGGHLYFEGKSIEGKPQPELRASFASAPANEMALFEPLHERVNPTAKEGPALLQIIGGAMLLDEMRLRHVVVQNVLVYYTGPPFELEDVVFVNCTFVLPDIPNESAKRLAEAVLSSTRVTITA